MKISKKLIAPAAVISLGLAAGGATTIAATTNNGGNYSPLVQRLAERFKLNPAEVQSIFKEQRAAKFQERQAKLKDRLDQAVKDGKISQHQADQLITKLKELHTKYKSEVKVDRRANHRQLHQELKQWAKDQGIDLKNLLPAKQPAHPAS